MLTRTLFIFLALCFVGCKKSASSTKNEDSPEIVHSINSVEEYNMLSPPDMDDSVKWVLGLKEPGIPAYFMNGYNIDTHDGILNADGFPREKYSEVKMSNWFDMVVFPLPQPLAAGVLSYSATFKHEAFPTTGAVGFRTYVSDDTHVEGCEDLEKARFSPEEVQHIVLVQKRLKETVTFIQGKLVMLLACEQMLDVNKEALSNKGIIPFLEDKFLELKNEPTTYNAAKSYGFLKYITAEEYDAGEYTAKDILIFESLPIDIGPLSGVITKRHQVKASHVYLRAKNQNIPNIFLPEADDRDDIEPSIGQLVEFETKDNGTFTMRNAEDFPGGANELQNQANNYFDSRVPNLPEPQLDLSNKDLFVWRDGTPSKALVKSYGAKGTNFAILDTALNKAGYNREGYRGSFLIPFYYYKEHVSQVLNAGICAKALVKCQEDFDPSGCVAANQACTALAGQNRKVEDFLGEISSSNNNPQMLANAKYRKGYLGYAQAVIKETPFVQATLQKIKNQISAAYATTERMRFRSSTNAEDLPGLTGAGLYESKAGCLGDSNTSATQSACLTEKEMARTKALITRLEAAGPTEHADLIKDLKKDLKKKSLVEDAIRKVYASLWNERAYLQRDYYRIDHKKIHMAILVHPSFADETANGVALIEEMNDKISFNIVSQVDDISITNPIIKGAFPEQITVLTTFDGQTVDTQLVANSNQNPSGGRVMSDANVKDLVKQLLVLRQKLKEEYGADYVKTLDSEFKLDESGRVQMKQIRPF
ncbi:MAG: PEP/pyruvate-binding domain-containing protein [Oligoflexales bacterium]